MEIRYQVVMLASFLAGLFVAGVFLSINGMTGLVVMDTNYLSSIPSPSDTLNESAIQLFKDRVIIKLNNASVAGYSSSGSMAPLITEYAHGIRVKPLSIEEIQVGDIISFNMSNATVVHRVVEIGRDAKGVYFITKGDASASEDGTRIRFDDIEWKIVAIIY